MNKMLYAIAIIVSVSIGAVAFQFLATTESTDYALYYQEPRTIPAFELTDEDGNSFANSALENHWSFAFLGYTSCPDVCPITLQSLNAIYDDLQQIANNSQVLLISADPKRDSQEKLAQYIAYFNPEFKALRAEHNVLFPFTRSLGLMYAITDDTNDNANNVENYWVDHSASLILINPDGKISAIFKPEQALGEVPSINTEQVLTDFKKIVALD
ncbi:SCO family protein [Colwellia sp. D2M02]|uniref:SCO family protein n=1 Tax=Colwellia sp. D2M02 TaxID=2841562 RepID=UPI001C083F33|nr:SCO family protein [Colwellia sp. D2M02]MBU2892029.1 SCO family protein [Colwellia sp. D2M02]